MKRILTFLLSMTLVVATLAVSAFAIAVPPTGAATGSNIPELATSTQLPDMTKLISQDLPTAQKCSVKGILHSKWIESDIPVADQYDIGNHYKYGFSVWGALRLQKYVSSAVDGVWATGNHGAKVESEMAGQGAFTWYMNDSIYNYKGESVKITSEDAYKNGYIYEMLMTFNFGKIAELDSFAFVTTYLAGFNQAADIYVSNNGTDWTLVGYYDRNQMILDSEEVNSVSGSQLGIDGSEQSFNDLSADAEDGTKKNKGVIVNFELPENTKGQFLRIATTCGVAKNSNALVYGQNLREWNDYADGSWHTFRELMVFGTLTDEVGYTYQEGDGDMPADLPNDNPGDTTGGDTTGGDTSGDTTTKPSTKPSVKPGTNNNDNTNNTEALAQTEAPDEEKKGGCGSVLGGGVVVLASIGCGAAVLMKRRKED